MRDPESINNPKPSELEALKLIQNGAPRSGRLLLSVSLHPIIIEMFNSSMKAPGEPIEPFRAYPNQPRTKKEKVYWVDQLQNTHEIDLQHGFFLSQMSEGLEKCNPEGILTGLVGSILMQQRHKDALKDKFGETNKGEVNLSPFTQDLMLQAVERISELNITDVDLIFATELVDLRTFGSPGIKMTPKDFATFNESLYSITDPYLAWETLNTLKTVRNYPILEAIRARKHLIGLISTSDQNIQNSGIYSSNL